MVIQPHDPGFFAAATFPPGMHNDPDDSGSKGRLVRHCNHAYTGDGRFAGSDQGWHNTFYDIGWNGKTYAGGGARWRDNRGVDTD